MSDNQDLDILNEHKRLMIITNKLSEFQIKNLKMYPFILFDNVVEVKIEHDLDLKKGSGFVVYKIKTKEKQTEKQKKDTLKKWVQTLLFEDVKVKCRVSHGSN